MAEKEFSLLNRAVFQSADAIISKEPRKDLLPEFMFGTEASQYLNTTPRKIALYRKYGLLRWSKFGKNYVYKKSWLDDFAETWACHDLSNEEAVRLAVRSKEWKDKHHL